jgi:glutamyl-tRNA synthetase
LANTPPFSSTRISLLREEREEAPAEGRRAGILREELAALEAVEPFTAAATDAALHDLGARTGRQMGDLVHPVRVAVSGTGVGPGLFDMLATLGKERALRRIRRTLALYGG